MRQRIASPDTAVVRRGRDSPHHPCVPWRLAVGVGCLVLLATACSEDVDPRTELLQSQEIERRAHLQYDAAQLTSLLADTVVTLQKGTVRAETPNDKATVLRLLRRLHIPGMERPASPASPGGHLRRPCHGTAPPTDTARNRGFCRTIGAQAHGLRLDGDLAD